MNWNYRVLRRTFIEDGEAKEYYGIHEVYYDEEGKPKCCTVDAIALDYFGNVDGVKWALHEMMKGLADPILDYEDFCLNNK